MNRRWFSGVLLCALALPGCKPAAKTGTPAAAAPAAPAAKGPQVMVFVPCGMAGPYGELEQSFGAVSPNIKLRRKVGNYVSLCDEVKGGAKPDVLLNLGERELEPLIASGALKKENIYKLAIMPLALAAPPKNPHHIKSLKDLLRPEIKAIAVGDPATLSLGAATKQALQKLGLWDKLQKKLVPSPKATYTMSEVADGKVDASIVYRSCLGEVHTPGEVPKETNLTYVCDIPGKFHAPIFATASVVTGAADEAAALEFVKFISREDNQAVFVKWQYDALPKPADKKG